MVTDQIEDLPAGENTFSDGVGALDDVFKLLSLADSQPHCPVSAQIPFTGKQLPVDSVKSKARKGKKGQRRGYASGQ